MTSIANDPRFVLVTKEADRERLFDDYLRERVKREREEERLKKRDHALAFRDFLKRVNSISINTEWRTFAEEYKNEPTFMNCDRADALGEFIEVMREIERGDEESVRKQAQRRLRDSRKAREGFRSLLDEHWASKKINVKTKWKQFRPTVKSDPRYLAMVAEEIEGSTPSEVFYDLIDDLEERYQRDKKKLKEILKEQSLVIDAQTSYLVFEDKIKKHDNFDIIDPVNFKLLYHDLREKALKEEEKMKRKARRRFNEVLDRLSVRNTSTWDSVQKRIPKTADVQYLPLSDAERLDVFNEHMKRRAMDNDFDSVSELEEGEQRRERKSKSKRHRSRSLSSSRESEGSEGSVREERRKRSRDRRDDEEDDDRDRKRSRKDSSKH
jgi:pre-mRNA-processing factor 40